jgi:hypothetical protein
MRCLELSAEALVFALVKGKVGIIKRGLLRLGFDYQSKLL